MRGRERGKGDPTQVGVDTGQNWYCPTKINKSQKKYQSLGLPLAVVTIIKEKSASPSYWICKKSSVTAGMNVWL
jgi:hypothetical protein